MNSMPNRDRLNWGKIRVTDSIINSSRGVLVALILSLTLGTVNAEQTPAFDVASIRPAPSQVQPGRAAADGSGRVSFLHDGVSGRNLTARRIIMEAYHFAKQQVLGGPDWLDSASYDVEAKANGEANNDQLRKMLQSLLAERFKLKVQQTDKEMPVYALTVSKHGLKLAPLISGEPLPKLDRPHREGVKVAGNFADRGTVAEFAADLSTNPSLGRPVVDRTGLTGTFLFFVTMYSDEDVVASLETQLGLKLEPQKSPLPVVMVDHIEKPTEN
jgi:uncharacterized protein (TIGR03435 family)